MEAKEIIEALNVKRNVLLNPGPATTTDTVKLAQIVPDICPREKEFGQVMRDIQADLVKIVHGDPEVYTAVLFCGSGTKRTLSKRETTERLGSTFSGVYMPTFR